MSNIKLASPRLRVILGDPENDATWTEHEFQTIGKDAIMAETLAGVEKWGRLQDHPLQFLSGTAYYAMMRRGMFSGPYDTFAEAVIEIQPVGMDQTFPTVTGPEPD